MNKCPYGCKDVITSMLEGSEIHCRCTCYVCGCSGPWCSSEKVAIKKWNMLSTIVQLPKKSFKKKSTRSQKICFGNQNSRITTTHNGYGGLNVYEEWGYNDETRKPHWKLHKPPKPNQLPKEINGIWYWVERKSS